MWQRRQTRHHQSHLCVVRGVFTAGGVDIDATPSVVGVEGHVWAAEPTSLVKLPVVATGKLLVRIVERVVARRRRQQSDRHHDAEEEQKENGEDCFHALPL